VAVNHPMEARRQTPRMITYPTLMLGLFFLVPFAFMIVVSFWQRIEGAESGYAPGFEFTHYARFFSPLFTRHLLVSLEFASLSAFLSVLVAFPFTYFLSRFGRRPQVLTLVFVLCVLSLSEVIVAYSWSVLLSRTAGISNLFVFLGIMEKPSSWIPSYGAVLFALTYFNLPFATLIMYPQCTRLEKSLTEAALTLGASPVKTFFTVVVPLLWPTIFTAFIVLFVFTMGAFITPQWLGRPQHWMYAILINNQANIRGNVPFASALSIFLMVFTLTLVAITVRLGRRGLQR